MGRDHDEKRRLSPREELRRFYRPQDSRFTRREILGGLLGGAALGCERPSGAESGTSQAPDESTPTPKRSAYDLVELGRTGIKTSRLAMGSGTDGFGGTSVQTRMGAEFTQMLVRGYERGVRFFETADSYGAHGVVGQAAAKVGRKNVTILTKTMAETEEDAAADLERFFRELDTDYIDIVLLHVRTSPKWTTESAGAMEVLARAKKQGRIRAHGVSCHSLAALRLAKRTEWVDVDLARINPFGVRMDADPATVLEELREMKAAGKSVIGMKIFGGGENTRQFDRAIAHAARLDVIDAFTIGFTSPEQLDQVADAIAKA